MLKVEQTAEGWTATCPRCGWEMKQTSHIPTRHRCQTTGEIITYIPPDWESRKRETGTRVFRNEPVAPPAPKLGDSLQEFFESHGITEEWYSGFKEQFGLPPGCGCKKRRDWLNQTAEAHPQIANFGAKLLNALKKR
jgi:hypothetical protein